MNIEEIGRLGYYIFLSSLLLGLLILIPILIYLLMHNDSWNMHGKRIKHLRFSCIECKKFIGHKYYLCLSHLGDNKDKFLKQQIWFNQLCFKYENCKEIILQIELYDSPWQLKIKRESFFEEE